MQSIQVDKYSLSSSPSLSAGLGKQMPLPLTSVNFLASEWDRGPLVVQRIALLTELSGPSKQQQQQKYCFQVHTIST